MVGVFGIKGVLKVLAQTHFIERFDPGEKVWINDRAYTIDWTAWHKGQVRIGLKGISTNEQAEELIGENVTVPIDHRPELEEDEFYAGDLIGLKVITKERKELGKVDELITGPAQDLLRIGEILIPMVKAFVKKIDLNKGVIEVELIPGMLPGEDV